MAKVDIDDRWLIVRVTWLERWFLSEKPRRCPLSKVRGVNPHPDLLDMLLYWTDQRGVWLYGATTYEGYLVPSTRKPSSTLAIEVVGERTWYVELDDQEPAEVAAQIEQAIGMSEERTSTTTRTTRSAQVLALPSARPRQDALAKGLEPEPEQTRSPRAKQSRLSVVPRERDQEPSADSGTAGLRTNGDHLFFRVGGWLLGLGAAGMLAGVAMVATGAAPGLLLVGAGLACAVLGGLALGRVAHHRG